MARIDIIAGESRRASTTARGRSPKRTRPGDDLAEQLARALWDNAEWERAAAAPPSSFTLTEWADADPSTKRIYRERAQRIIVATERLHTAASVVVDQREDETR